MGLCPLVFSFKTMQLINALEHNLALLRFFYHVNGLSTILLL